jgi:hypothetical protein
MASSSEEIRERRRQNSVSETLYFKQKIEQRMMSKIVIVTWAYTAETLRIYCNSNTQNDIRFSGKLKSSKLLII